MIGENRQLVTDQPVEVPHCRKSADRLRGIYRIYPNLIKENQRMSTCNRVDLQMLGSQPVMPKNFPITAPDICLQKSSLGENFIILFYFIIISGT